MNVDEYIRCKNDPVYFVENNVIVDWHPFFQTIIPLDHQKEALEFFHKNKITTYMAHRQSGKTLTSALYVVHHVLFNSNSSVGVHCCTVQLTTEFIRLVADLLHYASMMVGVGYKESKNYIALSNGSRISGISTPNSARGISFSLLVLDEIAFSKEKDDLIKSLLPVIVSSKKAKMIMVSSPCSQDFFWNIHHCGIYSSLTHDVFCTKNKKEIQVLEDKYSSNMGIESYARDYLCSLDIQDYAHKIFNLNNLPK